MKKVKIFERFVMIIHCHFLLLIWV